MRVPRSRRQNTIMANCDSVAEVVPPNGKSDLQMVDILALPGWSGGIRILGPEQVWNADAQWHYDGPRVRVERRSFCPIL